MRRQEVQVREKTKKKTERRKEYDWWSLLAADMRAIKMTREILSGKKGIPYTESDRMKGKDSVPCADHPLQTRNTYNTHTP